MRHRRLIASLPLAGLLAAAGCSSNSHGSAHVGSIPSDDFHTPVSHLGPGAEVEYSAGGPNTPGNGTAGTSNAGATAPSKGSGGHGSGSTVHVGKGG